MKFKNPFKKKPKHKKMHILIGVIAVLFIAWVSWGYFSVSSIEELPYEVLQEDKEYEIREIKKHIVAQTTVEGAFRDGNNNAFRIIAGYIFGDNKRKEPIAMTTPVIQEESEPIAMTTPVITDEEGGAFKMAFVMPSKYTLETLPEPLDKRVEIVEVEPYKVAALRFSGFYRESNYDKNKVLLASYLERDGIEFSKIVSAGYNPPWTPPFMTRLEVWALID